MWEWDRDKEEWVTVYDVENFSLQLMWELKMIPILWHCVSPGPIPIPT